MGKNSKKTQRAPTDSSRNTLPTIGTKSKVIMGNKYEFNGPVANIGPTAFGNKNTFNIADYHNQNLELQRDLNEPIRELRKNGHQEEAAEAEEIVNAVKEDNSLEDGNDIKASGFLNKVKRFLNKANDENSTLHKIVIGIRDGAEIGEIAKAYNNTVKLLGLS